MWILQILLREDYLIVHSGYSSGSRARTCTAILLALAIKLRLFFDKKRQEEVTQGLICINSP